MWSSPARESVPTVIVPGSALTASNRSLMVLYLLSLLTPITTELVAKEPIGVKLLRSKAAFLVGSR